MRGHVLQKREQSVNDPVVLGQKGRFIEDEDDGGEARSEAISVGGRKAHRFEN